MVGRVPEKGFDGEHYVEVRGIQLRDPSHLSTPDCARLI